MLGRTKTNGEDVFEIEEKLSHELQGAREQLVEVTTQITAAETEYRKAAVDAVTSGCDDAAIKLKRALEKLAVHKDGLQVRIADDLEPRFQEATKLAQAERLAQNERARQGKLADLIEEGKQAEEVLRFAYEQFMLALSRFDDLRAALGAQEFGLDGLRAAGALAESVFLFGPQSLPGRLLSSGWTQRVGIRPAFIEVTALKAPLGA
jgi:hypothetical protein